MLTFDSTLPPNELSLLAGASGAGKSTLIIQALAAWTLPTPREFLGICPEPGRLRPGYIVADRGAASLADHAKRAGLDMDRVTSVSIVDDLDLNLTWLKADPLKFLIDRLDTLLERGVNFAVVDPVMLFLGADLNRYHLVAPALLMLNRFCKQHNLTLLGIHHTTKARSDFAFLRPQDRISGSSALAAFTSTQWALWSREELPDEEREAGLSRLDIISHVAPPDVVWMRRQQNGLFVKGNRSDAVKEELGPIASAVLSGLTPTPMPAGTIVSYLSQIGSRASIYRALDQLTEKGLVVQPSRGFYALSEPSQPGS